MAVLFTDRGGVIAKKISCPYQRMLCGGQEC